MSAVGELVRPSCCWYVCLVHHSVSVTADTGADGGRGLSGRRTADVVCVLAKVHMLLLNISSPLSGCVGLIKTGNMMSPLQI